MYLLDTHTLVWGITAPEVPDLRAVSNYMLVAKSIESTTDLTPPAGAEACRQKIAWNSKLIV